MTKLEKVVQMELKRSKADIEARIVKMKCPHHYGLKDMSPPTVMCTGHCKECWSEEVEDDET